MIVEKRIGDSLYEVDWYAKGIQYTYKDKEGNTINAIFIPSVNHTTFRGMYKKNKFNYTFDSTTQEITCSTTHNECPPNSLEETRKQYIIFNNILKK